MRRTGAASGLPGEHQFGRSFPPLGRFLSRTIRYPTVTPAVRIGTSLVALQVAHGPHAVTWVFSPFCKSERNERDEKQCRNCETLQQLLHPIPFGSSRARRTVWDSWELCDLCSFDSCFLAFFLFSLRGESSTLDIVDNVPVSVPSTRPSPFQLLPPFVISELHTSK